MPTIYSGTNDGYIMTPIVISHVTARQTTSTLSFLVYASSTGQGYDIAALYTPAGGRSPYPVYAMRRVFFEFDTSGISVTPASADLKIYGNSQNSADFIVVKSEQSSPLHEDDIDAITGAATAFSNSDGSGTGTLAGNVTLYSGLVAGSGWSTSGYNTISLTLDARVDMRDLSLFKVCCIEYDHDYLDITQTTLDSATGLYYADYHGTSRDPYIDYTAGTAAVTDNATFFGANF